MLQTSPFVNQTEAESVKTTKICVSKVQIFLRLDIFFFLDLIFQK